MSSRLSKCLLCVLAAFPALALGACGDSHTRVTSGTYAGESGANAPYLNVGPLTYEVQLSRQLNPYNTEDAEYLKGLTAAQRKLEPGQEWFGVFVQVYNTTPEVAAAVPTMTISDTQGNVYEPVVPNETNPFAYRGGKVPPGGRIPEPDATAAAGASQGALLLYKIQIVSLDNRPLKFSIVNPREPEQRASAELDV